MNEKQRVKEIKETKDFIKEIMVMLEKDITQERHDKLIKELKEEKSYLKSLQEGK